MKFTTAPTAAPSRTQFRPDSGPSPPPGRVLSVALPWAEYVATWPLARAWGITDLEELIREALRRAARGVDDDNV